MRKTSTKEAAWRIHQALTKPGWEVYPVPLSRGVLVAALRVLENRLHQNRQRKLRREQ